VKEIVDLVDELSRTSAAFARFSKEKDVYAPSEGVKCLEHPQLGVFEMEYSAFAVDGRPDLGLLV
jgi:MmyB-like transcription regulator ligand binding domain